MAPVLRARDAGIPVIMFDSSIDAQTDKFAETFVATDMCGLAGLPHPRYSRRCR